MGSDATDQDASAAVLAAMAEDVSTLALLHDREASGELLDLLKCRGFPGSLLLPPAASRMQAGAALLKDALAQLKAPYPDAELDELAADYAAIYLTHGLSASPLESVWTDPEGLALQDATFRLRQQYRIHGLVVENWRHRSEDHLVVQLHFLALMLGRLGVAAIREVASFMDEHLLRWLPVFATRVVGRCATRFYAGVALLTDGYCDQMRDVLAEMLGEPRPALRPLLLPGDRAASADEEAGPFLPGSGPSW